MSPELRPGLVHEFTLAVPANKTVPHVWPEFPEFGEMPAVLATGFMVALIEGVCQRAIKPYLDWPREQSVGTHVNFSHLAATPPGMRVTVRCEVVAVEGRKVRFKAEAWDARDKISEGTHERAVIDAQRFNAKLTEKTAGNGR